MIKIRQLEKAEKNKKEQKVRQKKHLAAAGPDTRLGSRWDATPGPRVFLCGGAPARAAPRGALLQEGRCSCRVQPGMFLRGIAPALEVLLGGGASSGWGDAPRAAPLLHPGAQRVTAGFSARSWEAGQRPRPRVQLRSPRQPRFPGALGWDGGRGAVGGGPATCRVWRWCAVLLLRTLQAARGRKGAGEARDLRQADGRHLPVKGRDCGTGKRPRKSPEDTGRQPDVNQKQGEVTARSMQCQVTLGLAWGLRFGSNREGAEVLK